MQASTAKRRPISSVLRFLHRWRLVFLPFIAAALVSVITFGLLRNPIVQSASRRVASGQSPFAGYGDNFTLVNVTTIFDSLLIIIGTTMYLMIDYNMFRAPLAAEDPHILYSLRHHLQIVTFPLLNHKRRSITYWSTVYATSLASLVLTILVLTQHGHANQRPLATLPAGHVQQTSAQLNGVMSSTVTGITTRGFEYGSSTHYDNTLTDTAPTDYGFANEWGEKQTYDYASFARSSNGDYYLTDQAGKQVVECDASGKLVRQWGSAGTGDGNFDQPGGIAVNPDGTVVVADGNRIQKFDSTGKWLATWPNGQANYGALAVDGDGNVYAVNDITNDVLKLDASSGKLITTIPQVAAAASPVSLSVDSKGQLWVLNVEASKLQIYDAAGHLSQQFSTDSNGFTAGHQANGLLVTAKNVYVQDVASKIIKQFSLNGEYQAQWSNSTSTVLKADGQLIGHFNALAYDGTNLININGDKFDSSGKQQSQLAFAQDNDTLLSAPGVAVDQVGHVYAVDQDANRIVKYDAAGNALQSWGSPGSGDGQFNKPSAIAIDNKGQVYVADSLNQRIEKFTGDGKYLAQFGSSGGDGVLHAPKALAIDGNVLYVADNQSILRFSTAGQFQSTVASTTASSLAVDTTGAVFAVNSRGSIEKYNTPGAAAVSWPTQYKFSATPLAVAVDQANNLYVLSARSIQKFNPDGQPSAKWSTANRENLDVQPTITAHALAVGPDETVFMTLSATDASSGTPLTLLRSFSPPGIFRGGQYHLKVSDLTCGKLYHFRAFASSKSGTVTGGDTTLHSAACNQSPTVSDEKADATATNAKLQASLTNLGSQNVTDAGFEWGTNNSYGSKQNLPANTNFSNLTVLGGAGQLTKQTEGPSAVAHDSNGNVYVADTAANKIVKFSGDGTFIAAWASPNLSGGLAISSADIVYSANTNHIDVTQTDGTVIGQIAKDGHLKQATGLAFDNNGNLFIADSGTGTIISYDGVGDYRTTLTTVRSARHQTSQPSAIAIDDQDNLYVADSGYLTQYNATGRFTTQWLVPDKVMVTGLSLDSRNNLYIAGQSGRIIAYPPSRGSYSDLQSLPSGDQHFTPVGISVDSDDHLWMFDGASAQLKRLDVPGTVDPKVFSVSLENLSCGSQYHYRAYADTAAGIVNGSDHSFSTQPCTKG